MKFWLLLYICNALATLAAASAMEECTPVLSPDSGMRSTVEKHPQEPKACSEHAPYVRAQMLSTLIHMLVSPASHEMHHLFSI